ncbi:MAG: hypothetical protein HN826_12520 [Methylococcales bacterium]|nr:hypothetical protein [Methylococcales bacterium]
MEEERRLFYVGMTRAKEKLHLTHACSRQRFGGRPTLQKASQFIEEIPSQYVISEKSHQQHFARTQYYEQKPKYKSIKSASAFELGQRVLHKKFGEGIILDHEGEGDRARVQVHFDAEGSKWLAVAYAKLETL